MEAAIESTAFIPSKVSASLILQPGQYESVEVYGYKPIKARISPSVLLIPHFKQFVAFVLFEVPEVRAVLMHQEGKLLRVYIVVNEYDFAVNERVYGKEEHLIDIFGNVDFDFHITSQARASGYDLEVILSR